MKCTFCGLPIILDKKLTKKLSSALNDFVIDEDSVEFLVYKTEDNDFLELCIKELSALKKRFPEKKITVTAIVKQDEEALGDIWYEEDENGEKSLIADKTEVPDICGAKTDKNIWEWVMSQCGFLFEYGYSRLEWDEKELTKRFSFKVLSLGFKETEFIISMAIEIMEIIIKIEEKNRLSTDNFEDFSAGDKEDIEKLGKILKYRNGIIFEERGPDTSKSKKTKR